MKKIVVILLSFLMLFSVSCDTKDKEDHVAQNFNFDSEKAMELGREAMDSIAHNNLKELERISDSEVVDAIKVQDKSTYNITAYQLLDVVQRGKKAMYKFNVAKAVKSEPKAILEEYYIRVDKKEDDKYQIGKISGSDSIFAEAQGQQVRIRFKDKVNMDTLIKLSEIPSETYIKSVSSDIRRVPVPKKSFKAIGLSFEQKFAMIATVEDNRSYVAVLEFNQLPPSGGSSDKGGDSSKAAGQDTSISSGLQQVLEKSIATKITTLDIFNDIDIEYLIFSNDDKYNIISYKNEYGVSRFKLYKNAGDKVKLNFDDLFNPEKYEITYLSCQYEKLKFNVKPAEGKEGIRKEVIGTYSLDLEDMKVQKI